MLLVRAGDDPSLAARRATIFFQFFYFLFFFLGDVQEAVFAVAAGARRAAGMDPPPTLRSYPPPFLPLLSLFPLILPHSTDLGARAPPREGTPAGKREKEPPAKTPVCNSGKFSSSSSSSHSLSLLLLPSPISYMIRFFIFPSLPLSPALLFLQ